MKNLLQTAVASAHRRLLRRPMPDRFGVYLHSLRGQAASSYDLLCRFKDAGYSFVGADEFIHGTGRRIFLSFDDNYSSWFDCMSLFDRLRIKATFYVNTFPFRDRASGKELAWFFSRISAPIEPTLTTKELRSLADNGHSIGAHTHTHPKLTSISFDEAKDEIRTSKLILEDIIDKPVTDFSYPFGMRRHFSRALRDYCFEIGFKTVATAIPCMSFARTHAESIHRTHLFPSMSFAHNVDNIRADGRLFSYITGLSAIGNGY